VVPGQGRHPFTERLGAVPFDDGTVDLRVWAPEARSLAVHTADGAHPLDCGDEGLWGGRFPGSAGSRTGS